MVTDCSNQVVDIVIGGTGKHCSKVCLSVSETIIFSVCPERGVFTHNVITTTASDSVVVYSSVANEGVEARLYRSLDNSNRRITGYIVQYSISKNKSPVASDYCTVRPGASDEDDAERKVTRRSDELQQQEGR